MPPRVRCVSYKPVGHIFNDFNSEVVVKMAVDTQLHFPPSANFPANSTLFYRMCNMDKAQNCPQPGPLSPPPPIIKQGAWHTTWASWRAVNLTQSLEIEQSAGGV